MKIYHTLILFIFFWACKEKNSSADERPLQFLGGSTVLALVSPDTAWVVGDSKLTNHLTGLNEAISPGKIRKIHETNGFVFGLTGDIYIKQWDTPLINAIDVIKTSLNTSKDFDSAYNATKRTLSAKLSEIISVLKITNNNTILDRYRELPIFRLVLLTYKKGYLQCKELCCYLYNKETDVFEPTFQEVPAKKGNTEMFFLGVTDAVFKSLQTNKLSIPNHKIKDRLVCLIAQQSKATPDEVGMPADFVIVTKKGTRWTYGINACNGN